MKLALVVTLSVLAFTASFHLPRNANRAGDEGMKNDKGLGEEDEKRIGNTRSTCKVDDAGEPICKQPGYCTLSGEPCDQFYFCIRDSLDLKLKKCTCVPGYIFSDVDVDKPCIEGSCKNAFIVNLNPLVSAGETYKCITIEEPTTEGSTTSDTTITTHETTDTTQETTESPQESTSTTEVITESTQESTSTTEVITESPQESTSTTEVITESTQESTSTTEVMTESTQESTSTTEVITESPQESTSTTEVTTETTSHVNTDTTQELTTTTPFECQGLGTYPDPQDCHSFFRCVSDSSGNIILQHKKCPSGQYFNVDDLACEPGSCYPTTTTIFPFECPSLGVFPDPGECHHYYTCKASLDGDVIQERHECDNGMYFDPEFDSCAYGDC